MLSDWESTLTELSDSEDEYVPAPKKKQKPTPEYKVTSSLQPYRTTTYTARSLYDQIIDGTIDLDPEYQRDIVWGEPKQSGLIDSILRNFYMPPVIFSVATNDDGTQVRTCIDGKQRLTSIQLFMDGLIPHRDIANGKKYWYKKNDTDPYLVLSKPLRQTFANKQITCIEYDGLTDDQEREIFQRVQLGVALTAAERMQAIPGPWPSLIREVQSIVLSDNGFGEDLDWGRDRGRDFQCLATIICLIDNHPNTSFPTSPKLEKWLSNTNPVTQKTRTDVLETFKIFIALVKNKKYNAGFKRPSRVSPVEFTMTGVLIYLYKKTYSLMQLSSAIWQMRADVRKQFSDIRANSKVVKVMFAFLEKRLKGAELASDGRGDIPATIAIKSAKALGISPDDSRTSSPEPPPKEKKRRRAQVSLSSDDSEYEPIPTKRRASMPGPQAASSRTAATKGDSSKTTTSRKVSAPATTKAPISASKASTSKAATKAPPKGPKASQRQDGRSSPSLASPSIPSQIYTPLVAKATAGLTTRKTRTAMSAALFAQPSTATGSIPQVAEISKKTMKNAFAPIVKMEVDLPNLGTQGPADESAMAVDDLNMAQSHPRATKPPSTPNHTVISPLEPHPDLGDVDTTPIEQMLGLSMNSAQTSPVGSPVAPAPPPPPPPPITAPPKLGLFSPGQFVSPLLQRQHTTSTITGAQPSNVPIRKAPTLPRADRARARSRSIDRDWDMDRSRDRGRAGSRDRYNYRDRDRDRDRRREPSTRDWKPPEAERRWRERSRERDQYRYAGRRGY